MTNPNFKISSERIDAPETIRLRTHERSQKAINHMMDQWAGRYTIAFTL